MPFSISPGRCQYCPKMLCRVYYPRDNKLTGYCIALRCKVQGDDYCHLPRQPTAPIQLELFSL